MHKQRNILILFLLGLLMLSSEVYANRLKNLYLEGDKAYQQGEHEKAIEIFEEVVELEPNFAPVYNALGLAHNAINTKLSDVIWLYDVAIDIDPKYIDAYINKCRAFYKSGDHDQAEQSCLEALEVRPNYQAAQLSLAWIYLVGKAEPDRATYYFEQVAKTIKEPMVYFGLGLAYSQKGDRVRVLDAVTQLRGLNSDELASQLEATIRTKDLPPVNDPFLAAPHGKPGQLIALSPPATAPPASVARQHPGELGSMKIRLRGKLSMGGQTKIELHPGSLTGNEGDQPKSAIERVKELQRRRGITY